MKLAAHRDIHELARLLGDEVFEEAAGVLEMIFQSPEDRQFYEARMKFLHDEEARLIAAREEGREEGSLAGKVQLLQQLNGVEEMSLEALLQRGDDELSKMLAELQECLRSRGD